MSTAEKHETEASEKTPGREKAASFKTSSPTSASTMQQQQKQPIEEENFGSTAPPKEKDLMDLAKQIGIDWDTEKDKYSWFLIQVLSLELPPNWTQEDGPDGKKYYHNSVDNSVHVKHPCLNKFRSIFLELLESEAVGRTSLKNYIKNYQEKLRQDPKVFKAMKEQFEDKGKIRKANKKNQTIAISQRLLKGGNNVTENKAQKLGTTEVLSLIDEGKSKERFDKIKDILQQRKIDIITKNNDIDNLDKSERILEECKIYYQELYGIPLDDIPDELKKNEEYSHQEPLDLVEAGKLFDIKHYECYLFWTLRYYNCIPLPDSWIKFFDINLNHEVYFNTKNHVKITVHPSYLYILDIIQRLRSLYKENHEEYTRISSKITLKDKLGRLFEIDLGGLLNDNIGSNNNGNMKGKTDSKKINYFNIAKPIENLEQNLQKKQKKKEETNPNLKDAHFMELASQAGININEEIHLIMVIEEFVRMKEKNEKWFYRQAPDGSGFWINHEQKRAVKEYPHLKDLKQALESYKQNQKLDTAKIKKDNALIKALFRKQNEDFALKTLLDEAKGFIDFYFSNKPLADTTEKTNNFDIPAYNLEKLSRLIGYDISENDLMDVLFYCPFNVEAYLDNPDILFHGSDSNLMKKIKQRPSTKNPKFMPQDDSQGSRSDSPRSNSYDSADERRNKIDNPLKIMGLVDKLGDINNMPNEPRQFLKLLIDFEKKYGDQDVDKDGTKSLIDNQSLLTTKSQANTKRALGQSIGDKRNSTSNFGVGSGGFETHLKNLNNNIQGSIPEGGNVSIEYEKGEKPIGWEVKNDDSNRRNDSAPSSMNLTSRKISRKNSYGMQVDPNGLSLQQLTSDDGLDNNNNKQQQQQKKSRMSTAQKLDSGDLKAGINEYSNYDQKANNTSNGGGGGGNKGIKTKEKISKNGDNQNESEGMAKSNNNKTLLSKNKINLRENIVKGKEGAIEMNFNTKTKDEVIDADGLDEKENLITSDGQMNEKEEEERLSIEEEGDLAEKKEKLISDDMKENDAKNEDKDLQKKRQDRKSKIENMSSGNSDYKRLLKGTENGNQVESIDDFIKKTLKLDELDNKPLQSNKKSTTGEKIPNEFEEKSNGEFKTKLDKSLVEIEYIEENSKLSHNEDKLGSKESQDLFNKEKKSLKGQKLTESTDIVTLFKTLKKVQTEILDDALWEEEGNKELEKIFDEINGPKQQDRSDGSSIEESKRQQSGALLAKGQNEKKESKFDLKQHSSSPEELKHGDKNRNKERLLGKSSVGFKKNESEMEGHQNSENFLSSIPFFESARARDISIAYVEALRWSLNFTNSRKVLENNKDLLREGVYGERRQWEFLRHLNSLIFIKRIDDLIIDYLLKQFMEAHYKKTGQKIQINDPKLRRLFRRDHRKLIISLREKLFQNKNFISKSFGSFFKRLLEATQQNKFNQIDKPVEENMFAEEIKDKLHFENVIMNKTASSINFFPRTQNELLPMIDTKQFNGQSIADKNDDLKLPPLGTNRQKTENKSRSLALRVLPKSEFSDDRFHKPPQTRSKEPMSLTIKEFTPSMPDLHSIKSARGNSQKNIHQTGRVPMTTQGESLRLLGAINEKDKINYEYYYGLIGDPLYLSSYDILTKNTILKVQMSYYILLMGMRFDLNLHDTNEADLAWIPYLILLLRLPEKTESSLLTTTQPDKLIHRLCYLKFGMHPGDKYFKTVVVYQKAKRLILMDKMDKRERMKYIQANSWLKFKTESGNEFYFNFMTKEKTEKLAESTKRVMHRYMSLESSEQYRDSIRKLKETLLKNDIFLEVCRSKIK